MSRRGTTTSARIAIRQGGSIMLAWVLSASVLLTLSALAWEVAHWQSTRHIAQLALLQAARAASRANLHPAPTRAAFLHTLRARFAGDRSDARMAQAFDRVRARTGGPAWQLERRSPGREAFARGDRVTARDRDQTAWTGRAIGKRRLRHDRIERDGQPRWLGDPAARARLGEAARAAPLLLHLRLTYVEPARFALLARLLAWVPGTDEASRRAYRAGMIVIRIDQRIEMQSDAVDWGDSTLAAAS